MRLKGTKLQNKEPELIEISSDDENSNDSKVEKENLNKTITKTKKPLANNGTCNNGENHQQELNGATKISSNEVSIISFEPWNVLGTDIDAPDFSALEQRLPNNDFQFNMPFAHIRFGTLEYSNGSADFITHKGISIVVKGCLGGLLRSIWNFV
jgi:hypothetical protein